VRRALQIAFSVVLGAVAPEAAAPPAPAAGPDAGARAQSLRSEATQLFKKKKYGEACDKFSQAAQLAADDAALLTDLALCQHRLGHADEARATNLRAIALASRDAGQIGDPAAAKIRRHAYFNLHQAGADASAPVPGNSRGTRCAPIAGPPGCARSFQACGYTAEMGYRLRATSRTAAKIALTPDGAAWTEAERGAESTDEPDYASLAEPPADKPQIVDDGFLVLTSSFQDEAHTGGCEDLNAWSCQRSQAVQVAARDCLRASPAAKGASTASAEAQCFDKACAELEKKPSPAVEREKRQAAKRAEACAAGAIRGTGSDYACGIVYANACTGLLAVACSGTQVGAGKAATRIDEYAFVPAAAAAPRPGAR
jgi:hypothetical protein